MLNVLREYKKSPYLKLVLALVGLGMVGYLGNYFFEGGTATATTAWVARVNGTEIEDWQFRDRTRALDEYYRQIFGQSYDQIRGQIGIRDQALQALIDREVMLQDARRLGLTTAPEEIADGIRKHPSFLDANGQFIGPDRYRQAIERSVPGGTPVFERSLAEQLVADKWINMVGQPVSVSEDELRAEFRKENEKTAIDYLVLASADQSIDSDVREDELRIWYDGHTADYRRGEGRPIRYLVIDRETARAKVQVTADDIRMYHERNQARYVHPEQRRASQVLMRIAPGSSDGDRARVRQAAEKILARAEAGEDFGALARSTSQDPETATTGGDLGFLSRGETFPALDQAVFETPVGRLAPIVEGPSGFYVIKVTGERPVGVTPLAEVESSIRSTLELEGAQERVKSEAERLRAELTDATRLAEVAQREGFAVKTRFAATGDPLREIGASPEFVEAVATLEPGQISAPLPIAAGLALVVAETIESARIAPFEDVRERVQTDVLNERGRKAALETARIALAKHGDLAATARSFGLAVQSADLAPGQALPGTGGTSPELEKQLFSASTAVSDRGVVPVPAGAVLYEVTRRDPLDETRFQSQKEDLLRTAVEQRRSRYIQSVIDRLRTAQTIEINRARVDAIGPQG